MKNIVLFTACLMMVSLAASAQDLLVIKGDSLNCNIFREDKNYVYFTYKHEAEVRNTLIAKSAVTTMQRGFYTSSDVSAYEVTTKAKVHKPWHVAFSLGGGYRIAAAAQGVDKSYINGLRPGWVLGADVDYYFSDYLGAGVKFSMFNASNKGYSSEGKIEDKVVNLFVGPVFATRILSPSKKNMLNMNLAFGYMRYRDDGKVGPYTGAITANTFGTVYEAGYAWGLSEHLALGVQLSLMLSSFSSATIVFDGQTKSGKLSSPENLSRIDLTVVFHILAGAKQ